MPSRSLTFNITTNDPQTIAALKRVQSELRATGAATAETGDVMARSGSKVKSYLTGFLALSSGKYLIDQANAAQVATRQTEAVIKSTGNAAGVSTKQQTDFANSLAQTAGVAPLVVKQATNLERTFTNIKGPQTFQRVLTDVFDTATAKGKDVSAVMTAVGKAMQDPVKGLGLLTRYGVTFTQQQKEQIKAMVEAGNAAGAQGVILGELETRFKGSAAAAATDSGKLSASIQVASQSIGQDLLPVVHGLASVAEGFARLPKSGQESLIALTALAVVGSKVGAAGEAIQAKWAQAGAALDAEAAQADAAAFAHEQLLASLEANVTVAEQYVVSLEAVGASEAEIAAAATAAAAASEALAVAEADGVAEAAGLASALGPAALAVGGLGAAYLLMGDTAERTKSNVDALASSISAGTSPIDAFNTKLAATLAGTKDGFSLDISGSDFRKGIQDIGVSAGDLSKVLLGPQKAFDDFINDIATKHPGDDYILYTLSNLRGAAQTAGSQTKTLAGLLKDLGLGSTDAAGKVDGLTQAFEDQAKAEAVLASKADKAEALFTAREGLAQATTDVASAESDLAKARQAEAGNSDEYRAAAQQEKDDQKAVAAAVTDVASAEHDLGEVEQKAIQTKKDLADATLRATISQRDANVALLDAKDKARAVLADGRSTDAEKRDAIAALADAQDNVTLAADATAKAQADQTDASVNGDQAVLDAKQKVVDAENKVKDTQAKVAADGRAKSKILADAALTVRDAQDKVNASLKTWADRYYDVQKATEGPLTALRNYAAVLADIEASIGPNGTFPKDLGEMLARLNAALADPSLPQPSTTVTPPARNPDATGGNHGAGTTGPGTLSGGTGPGHVPDHAKSLSGGVVINIHGHGSTTQRRRATARAFTRELGDLVRNTR